MAIEGSIDLTTAYDFLDIGCSGGGSLRWGNAQFGGRGVGVDIDPAKVEATVKQGFDAMLGDATALQFADDTFRFALIFDVLEHMKDMDVALRIVREAYRVSREFVLIRGPNFDGESQLRMNDLKRYYADWSGHTWHHEGRDIVAIVNQVDPMKSLVVGHERIVDSSHPDILPLSSGINQHRYKADIHGEKPHVAFKGRMFSRFAAVLAKRPEVDPYRLAFIASGSLLYMEKL
jgi:Methylase involved in ubiquinone/menaquinone biosynthesis